MLYLSYGEIKISVPQMWSELKLRQWYKLSKAQDNDEIIAAVTDMDLQMVKRLDANSREIILREIMFVSTIFKVSSWIVPAVLKLGDQTIDPRIDIKEYSYGQKILLTEEIKKESAFIDKLSAIVEVYFQTLLSKKHYDVHKTKETEALILRDILLCDAYAIAANYSEQLTAVCKMEADTLNKPPSNEQVAAGINMYNEFGVMNTIRALAKGDVLKVDEVLQRDYNTVYLWLKMAKVDSQYTDNYNAVLARKTKRGK